MHASPPASAPPPISLRFPRFIPRPKSETGIWSWIGTVDHKRIGTLYAVTSFLWFIVGGIEALLIRTQLSRSELAIIDPELYNQLFTMHGTTMVFLVVMPLSAAFFNWLIPLQIGARDVAFPRLNALSFWIFLFGVFATELLLGSGRCSEWRLVRLCAKLSPGLQPDRWHDVLGAWA